MTHLIAKTIALTTLSVALTACGTGKDASSAKVDSQSPVVNQRAAGITDDNLETVLAAAFNVTANSGPGMSDANQPRPAYMVGNLGDGLANIGNAQSESRVADSATGIDFQVGKALCNRSGTVNATVGLDTANLGTNGVTDFIKLYADFSFNECKTNQFWLNGKAKVSLSSQSGILSGNRDATILLKLNADLQRFYVAQPNKSQQDTLQDLDITGKVEFAVSNPERKYLRAELNGAAGSSLIYRVKKKEDQVIQLSEFESYLQSSMTDGTYAIGIKGNFLSIGKANPSSKSLPISRMKIYLEKPITGIGFAVPHEGVLVVESEKEIARFEILNQVDLKYTLDKGKDGSIDKQVDTTWSEFIEKNTGIELY